MKGTGVEDVKYVFQLDQKCSAYLRSIGTNVGYDGTLQFKTADEYVELIHKLDREAIKSIQRGEKGYCMAERVQDILLDQEEMLYA